MFLRPFTPSGECLSQSHHIFFFTEYFTVLKLMRELDVPKPKCRELHLVHAMHPIHSYSSVVNIL